jgi:hypothetical protein
MSVSSREHSWQLLAKRLSRKINFAWWLHYASTPLWITSLSMSVFLLWSRRADHAPSTTTCIAIVSTTLVLVGIVAWWRAKDFFESTDQSLVRLEAALELDSGLSSARAGVAPWPTLPTRNRTLLPWKYRRALAPPIAAAVLLALSAWIPLSQSPHRPTTPEEPLAWAKTQTELDQLEQDETIAPESITEIREKISDLRAQDPQDWFGHASLEATDHLRQEFKTEARSLAQEMKQAAKALETLPQNSALTQKERARLADEFQQAMEAMQQGGMKPNQKLMEQMKQLDPQQLQQLSPEQQKQLQKQLQQSSQQLDQAAKGDGENADEWLDELLADGSHPNDQPGTDGGEPGDGQQGEGKGQNGRGGVSRGPGHDPNLFGKSSRDLESKNHQALRAQDLSRARVGDLIELQNDSHTLDTSATSLRQGGEVSDAGKGGDRVWRESLAPHEQKTLKKFFE